MNMNRTFFLFACAAVCFAASVKAQVTDPTVPVTDDVRRKVRIGLQISPEMTWFKAQDKEITSDGARPGFSFGPMVDFRFGNNYAIGTGINIVNAQGRLFYETDSTKFNSFKDDTYYRHTLATYRVRYVEIPVLLRLSTNEIGYMTYFAHFGFMPGFKIGAKGSVVDDPSSPPDGPAKVDEDLGKDVTFPNMSLAVGIGLAYSLTQTTSLYVSAGFVNGFIDVTDNPKGYKSKAVLNRVPLTVGIWF